MRFTAAALMLALVLVIAGWVIGLIPWWLAVPAFVIGATSLAGPVGQSGAGQS